MTTAAQVNRQHTDGERRERLTDAPRHRRATLLPVLLALLLGGLALTVSARPDTGATPSVAASPPPGEETYQGCPPAGDGGDMALNLLKNRIDTGRWRATALPALLSLAWPHAVEKARRGLVA